MKKMHKVFLTLISIGIVLSLLFYFVIPETNCPCGNSTKADFIHPFGIYTTVNNSTFYLPPLCGTGTKTTCYPLEPNHFFFLSADITALIIFFYIQYMLEMAIRTSLKKKK